MRDASLVKGIRFKVTLIAVLGTLFAGIAIVLATAFALQSVMERTISNDLSEHLDKAEEAVATGNYELAVRFAGSDLMQVIGPDGAVLASSANARGLLAIIDDLDDDASEFEITDVRLREEAQKESSHDAASANSGDSAEGEARDASAAAVDASGQNDDTALNSSQDAAGGPYIEASSVFGNDGPYLVMKRKAEGPQGMVTIAAMTSLAPALLTAQTAAQLLVVVMLLALVIVAFAAWRLAGRTLRPVEQMRTSVEAIQVSDLSVRVPVPTGDRDLAPLAATFNNLLERIQVSVDGQKRFISDASHELKSPIAATSVMLEAMREYPDAVDGKQAVEDLTFENDRMARIVGNMLVLARHDEGRSTTELVPVDLFDVLHEEISMLASRSAVTVDASDLMPVVCVTDREQISHIVRNLLDNAARYASKVVKISCSADDETVRITVSDDGPGIPPADRERVFERFVRLESESARRKDSTGLGLSVAKSAVEELGGTVRFVEPEIGGATALVELPIHAL